VSPSGPERKQAGNGTTEKTAPPPVPASRLEASSEFNSCTHTTRAFRDKNMAFDYCKANKACTGVYGDPASLYQICTKKSEFVHCAHCGSLSRPTQLWKKTLSFQQLV
jgi:hypothetical protein